MIEERRHSLVGIALAVATGIVAGTLAVTAIIWVLVAVIHVVSWLLHVALVVGVVALAWWLLIGRRRHAHHPG
jgi:presenilin-like A22 family membrane protease